MRGTFTVNLLAGLSIAGLLLPEAVAYAGIAGLPPERAVLAGIAGGLAYAAFGRSRQAIIAPTSSSAAILAATLAAMPGGDGRREMFATLAVLLAGLFFLVAALFRLGSLTGFISRPVLKGFSFGLALTIIVHQLPHLFGLTAEGGNMALYLFDLFRQLPRAHAVNLSLGTGALALLILLKRYPVLPGPLVVLVGGVLVSHWLGPGLGVERVGPIHLSLDPPVLWPVTMEELSTLAQYTLPLVLILFAESWGTIRALALSAGDDTRANRELAALGLANLASALVRGMPVGAGFSAGSAAQAAGASSRLAGLLAATGLALLVLYGAGEIALLPKAIPAAVVIAALGHALDPKPFLRLWHLGRDNLLALGTAAGILAFGVLDGMLIAIGLSLLSLLSRLSHPVIARLGQLPGSRDFVDRARHADAVVAQDLAIFRPAAPLFYANAGTVLSAVIRLAEEDPAIRRVILSLEESFDLDTTALDELTEFDRQLSRHGISLAYARVHDHVRDLLARAGETDILSRCTYSVDDAVHKFDEQ